MPANGMALQVGRSVPRSSAGTALHHHPVEDAVELALGEDAARDEVVGLLVGPPLDDPLRHAGRDPRQLLELAQRGAVQVDGRGSGGGGGAGGGGAPGGGGGGRGGPGGGAGGG